MSEIRQILNDINGNCQTSTELETICRWTAVNEEGRS